MRMDRLCIHYVSISSAPASSCPCSEATCGDDDGTQGGRTWGYLRVICKGMLGSWIWAVQSSQMAGPPICLTVCELFTPHCFPAQVHGRKRPDFVRPDNFWHVRGPLASETGEHIKCQVVFVAVQVLTDSSLHIVHGLRVLKVLLVEMIDLQPG